MDYRKLPQISNVAASATATLTTSLLNGLSVHGLIFKLGGTTFSPADIDSIQLRVNSKTLIPQMSGSQLADINTWKGIGETAGFLSVYFGNPKARTMRGQHLTDLDLSVYRYPLEFTIKIGAGAVAPTLEIWAIVTPPKAALGMGYTADDIATLKAFLPTTFNFNGAVTKQALDISFGSAAGMAVENIHFFSPNIDTLTVKKQGVDIFEEIDDALNDQIQTNFDRAPVAGLFVYSPTVDRNISQALTTVMPAQAGGEPYSFNFLLTTTAAGAIETFTEGATKLGLL